MRDITQITITFVAIMILKINENGGENVLHQIKVSAYINFDLCTKARPDRAAGRYARWLIMRVSIQYLPTHYLGHITFCVDGKSQIIYKIDNT